MKNTLTIRSYLTRMLSACFLLSLLACNNNQSAQQQHDTAVVQTSQTTDTVPVAEPAAEVPKKHYGIDVSKWNGKEVTELTPSDSLTFVICKATQGLSSVDPDFKTNLSTIKQKGFISGAYHFYQVGDDPLAQAKHFWNTITAHGDVHIAPIVDIEQGSLPKATVSIKKLQADLLIFLNYIEQQCGRTPMIYTGTAFGQQYLKNEVFAKYPLWLAEYTSRSEPKIPSPWSAYKIWQRSDADRIKSIATDFDVYFGTKAELTK